MTKYIFITGGVVSSLGKGITAASIGCLLKSRGIRLTIQKLDPYINYDPGTMSPYQHGEVYVTEDGAETDLDLGHYERFINCNLSQDNNVTTGKVYWSVIQGEREGAYEGKTVQVIPHITNEIKRRIRLPAEKEDLQVVITEIGGTVGDIESLPFLEAIRQMRADLGKDNVIYIHVTLIPYLQTTSELKTKPTQHSVSELRSIGIQPDLIVCRTENHLPMELKEKIALFCDVMPDEVIENFSARVLYEVPLMLHKEGLDRKVIEKLNLPVGKKDLESWENFVECCCSPEKTVNIGLVGKYVSLRDAYISINESLFHAGIAHKSKVNVELISAEDLESGTVKLSDYDLDGILIPGGFGDRGIEGKIEAIRYAREMKVPYLGLCLGMQCAVIEFARNVAGLKGANSSEFDAGTKYPVIHLLPGQNETTDLGGTLRLGSYPCFLSEESNALAAYGEKHINERHRHRYEFNNDYRDTLKAKGLLFSGIYEKEDLVEIIELPKSEHPWFTAVQFHPEFKSRPEAPHPLFAAFIGEALKYSEKNQG